MKKPARTLTELERRIRRNLNKNKKHRGRGIDLAAEYREGYCNALRAVLRAITGKEVEW